MESTVHLGFASTRSVHISIEFALFPRGLTKEDYGQLPMLASIRSTNVITHIIVFSGIATLMRSLRISMLSLPCSITTCGCLHSSSSGSRRSRTIVHPVIFLSTTSPARSHLAGRSLPGSTALVVGVRYLPSRGLQWFPVKLLMLQRILLGAVAAVVVVRLDTLVLHSLPHNPVAFVTREKLKEGRACGCCELLVPCGGVLVCLVLDIVLRPPPFSSSYRLEFFLFGKNHSRTASPLFSPTLNSTIFPPTAGQESTPAGRGPYTPLDELHFGVMR